MGRRSSRRGASARRRGYYWDGVQSSEVVVTAADSFFILIDGIDQEQHPGTLVRVRGSIALRATTATSNAVFFKLMYLPITDAGAIPGDDSAIDQSEEDIAARQLWTHVHMQGDAPAAGEQPAVVIEVDIKAKLKLWVSGKQELFLLVRGVNNARTNVIVNLRALIMMA